MIIKHIVLQRSPVGSLLLMSEIKTKL